MNDAREAAASRLCMACGLCCDGALFTRVPLEAAELEREALAPLISDGRYLRQPCSALQAGCCQVYAQRPRVCRQFRCLLLEAMGAGEVDEAEAVGLVKEAREHVLELARRLHENGILPTPPSDGGRPLHPMEALRLAKADGRTLASEVDEAGHSLDQFLRRHFLGRS